MGRGVMGSRWWVAGPVLALTAVPAVGQSGDSGAASRFLESMDKDLDGRVSRAEWTGSGATFLQYDLDRDAYLTVEELGRRPEKQKPARTTPGEPDLSMVAVAIVRFPETPPSSFVNRCTRCHDDARIRSAVKDAVAWTQTVERMAAKEEADISARDVRRITDYLNSAREERARASVSYGTADPVAVWAEVLDSSDLHRHDRDGNGRLTAKELGRLLLVGLDFDGDGSLNPGEFRLMPLGPGEFARLDRNRNGLVTARELGVPDGLWEVLDQDGDRSLTMEELPRARPGPFRYLFGLDADSVLAQVDRNRDGALSPKEIRNSEDVFRLADRDRNNELDADEVQLALDRARAAGLIGAFDDFLTRYDLDGDGRVLPEEFPGPPHVFRRCDGDQDGVIDAGDAPAGYRRPEFSPEARRWRTTYRIVR